MFKNMKGGRKPWANMMAQNDNAKDISFFDVKDLYDRAYEERAKAIEALRAAQKLMAQAQGMDAAYRAQLKVKTPYGRKMLWSKAS